MRNAKQIAFDIVNGDEKAKKELEKMMGKRLEEMNDNEKKLGVIMLSTFETAWNK